MLSMKIYFQSRREKAFSHILRTNIRIFEILTAYVQVWSKWWQKNVVAENLLPVRTGKGFLLKSWELIDGFSKFKRHMFRFDRSDDGKMLSLKSTSGFYGKRLFAHILRTNGRIFEIQTSYFQVWLKCWWKNVVTKNILPVLTGKDSLLISWELIDGFSKFKRHMFRFDRSEDLTF